MAEQVATRATAALFRPRMLSGRMLHVQALGIKPKTIRAPKQPSLDQKDLQQLMQKGEEEEDAAEGGDREAERIKGLGFTV